MRRHRSKKRWRPSTISTEKGSCEWFFLVLCSVFTIDVDHSDVFGLSNFSPFGVELVHKMCKERGYVLPSVYQGSYSLLDRGIEKEWVVLSPHCSRRSTKVIFGSLIPLLRTLKMRILGFSPLAWVASLPPSCASSPSLLHEVNTPTHHATHRSGGLLAGTLKNETDPGVEGGRFDNHTLIGQQYRDAFTTGNQFEFITSLSNVTVSSFSFSPCFLDRSIGGYR